MILACIFKLAIVKQKSLVNVIRTACNAKSFILKLLILLKKFSKRDYPHHLR